MAGRVSRGEAWRFASPAHELALRAGGSLAYLERYALGPGDRDMARPWAAGSAHYFATRLVHHPDASRDIAERWHRASGSSDARVQAAVDLIAPRLIAARVASADGTPFSRIRTSCRAAALGDIFCAPEFAGRK